MVLTHTRELVEGQTYYAVQGVMSSTVNEYTYRVAEQDQRCNCEHMKTISNWSCFTTREEADAILANRQTNTGEHVKIDVTNLEQKENGE